MLMYLYILDDANLGAFTIPLLKVTILFFELFKKICVFDNITILFFIYVCTLLPAFTIKKPLFLTKLFFLN